MAIFAVIYLILLITLMWEVSEAASNMIVNAAYSNSEGDDDVPKVRGIMFHGDRLPDGLVSGGPGACAGAGMHAMVYHEEDCQGENARGAYWRCWDA